MSGKYSFLIPSFITIIPRSDDKALNERRDLIEHEDEVAQRSHDVDDCKIHGEGYGGPLHADLDQVDAVTYHQHTHDDAQNVAEDLLPFLYRHGETVDDGGDADVRVRAFSDDPPEITDPYIRKTDHLLGPDDGVIKNPPPDDLSDAEDKNKDQENDRKPVDDRADDLVSLPDTFHETAVFL